MVGLIWGLQAESAAGVQAKAREVAGVMQEPDMSSATASTAAEAEAEALPRLVDSIAQLHVSLRCVCALPAPKPALLCPVAVCEYQYECECECECKYKCRPNPLNRAARCVSLCVSRVKPRPCACL